MRMKKIFALGLICLLFAMVQFVAPMTAPIDDDVGTCYFMSADQIQPDMNIATINSGPLYFSDYAIPVWMDVGYSACIYNSTSISEVLWQKNESNYKKENAMNHRAIKIEGLLRLDIGEKQLQGRSTSILI